MCAQELDIHNHKAMKTILINYKDVQFLIKCTDLKAKEIIYSGLKSNERDGIYPKDIKESHTIEVSEATIKTHSPYPVIHNKNLIVLAIDQIVDNWKYSTIRKELLSDVTNLVRGGDLRQIQDP